MVVKSSISPSIAVRVNGFFFTIKYDELGVCQINLLVSFDVGQYRNGSETYQGLEYYKVTTVTIAIKLI